MNPPKESLLYICYSSLFVRRWTERKKSLELNVPLVQHCVPPAVWATFWFVFAFVSFYLQDEPMQSDCFIHRVTGGHDSSTFYLAQTVTVVCGHTERRLGHSDRWVMSNVPTMCHQMQKNSTCFFTARVDWPPPPLTSCFYITRDGTSSLSLTSNFGWSDQRPADAEWRLDRRNHPDSRGWSGQWLAAAPAPQLGPQHHKPSGDWSSHRPPLTGPVWTVGAGQWGAGLVREDSRKVGVGGEVLGLCVQSWVTGSVGRVGEGGDGEDVM